jgi:hypothetical protein
MSLFSINQEEISQQVLGETATEMSFRLFKKVQMRDARRAMSGSVLMYVDAKSIERNEADEPFSTA